MAGYTISSCGAAYQVSNHAHIKIHIMADISMVRCFPHVINLACKAVLAAVTKTDLAEETAEDHIPNPTGRASPPRHFQDALKRDPIASLRSLIRNVRICHCNFHLLIYSQVQFRFEGPHFAEHTSRKLLKLSMRKTLSFCVMSIPDGYLPFLWLRELSCSIRYTFNHLSNTKYFPLTI